MNLRLEGQQWTQLLCISELPGKKEKILNPRQRRTKLKSLGMDQAGFVFKLGKTQGRDFWESAVPSSLLLVQNESILWKKDLPSSLHVHLYEHAGPSASSGRADLLFQRRAAQQPHSSWNFVEGDKIIPLLSQKVYRPIAIPNIQVAFLSTLRSCCEARTTSVSFHFSESQDWVMHGS